MGALLGLLAASCAAAALPRLEVSANRRYLVTEAGAPFFYLGDTAWQLLQRLDRGEIDHYLRVRAAQRFTVVQCVILTELDGLETPNRENVLPLHDLDPTQPNEAYFDLVDFLVERAAAHGLYVALLPTWGSHVEDKEHPLFRNYHLFTPDKAEVYGRWLGERYRSRTNVVWMLGGDRAPTGQEATWSAMAAGLRAANPEALLTYHTRGYSAAAQFWNDAPWLDFNLLQSGHARFSARNWAMIEREYQRSPVRPVFDAEPCYEAHPAAFDPVNPPFTDYDVRKAAYWAVFAGAFGHTYGHNSVWQMYRPNEDKPIVGATSSWRESLAAPGAGQMRHLRALMESRPYLSRIPDQSLVNDVGTDTDHVQVTRDGTVGRKDATTILVYLALYRGLRVDTSVLPAARLRCWWYDPRTGAALPLGEIENSGTFTPGAGWKITPDLGGPDWVLVIDDAAAGYGPPGLSPWSTVQSTE